MDDVLKVFTLFLHDAYAHIEPGRARPSTTALGAIAATIFEIGFQTIRKGHGPRLPTQLPSAVYLLLTPFLGPERARASVESMVSEEA